MPEKMGKDLTKRDLKNISVKTEVELYLKKKNDKKNI